MRAPPEGAGAGVEETTGGGGAAPAASCVSARAGRATAIANVEMAVASSSLGTTLAMTVSMMTMVFSFRGSGDRLRGLNQRDRLGRDVEAREHRGVADRAFGGRGDREAPGPFLGRAVAGRVGDSGRQARGVRRARL